MALCHMLSARGTHFIHALTVDHGLRAESAAEARQVGQWLGGWPQVKHHILTRSIADKPDRKIQEQARFDRYALLADYCDRQGIDRLFTAHHQDDQAETFLFRLAKGSGLDGLGAIRPVHAYGAALNIIRPLLAVCKDDLLSYCRAHEIPYVADPSNENRDFARVRLRRSYEILAAEGLTCKRLTVTAGRLARAREALDIVAGQGIAALTVESKPGCIVLKYAAWRDFPEEIRLRILALALGRYGRSQYYGPRLERLETLALRIFDEAHFKKATLGGCLVSVDRKTDRLVIEKEPAAA